MSSEIEWTTFVQPHKAFRLQYPSDWEHRVEDDGNRCGFGPRQRDDVSLWISIMPMRIDEEKVAADLPKMASRVFPSSITSNVRQDTSLRLTNLKGDVAENDQCGNVWVLVGGDLLLLANTQLPAVERDVWSPLFEQVIASLRITRYKAVSRRKTAEEVRRLLQEENPQEEFTFDKAGNIVTGRHRISLYNLFLEIEEYPTQRDEAIRRFVSNFAEMPIVEKLGEEDWPAIEHAVMPLLKPREYIVPDTPTQHLQISPWLGNVIICYAIDSEKTLRFITTSDLDRWQVDGEQVHHRALENLRDSPWPRQMPSNRQPGGGRVVLVAGGDGFSATRLIHHELHTLFAEQLGSPFLAGIPDRDTLVLFSNRRSLKKRIAVKVRQDHDKSAYSISPRLFLVTADGVAPAPAD